ncbi:SDR family NAD(P)-dependent oxidoreductase [Cellulomonas cellasea]|uniref:NAD(P)-dependent dehydrogenase (Short-subunit alcohol dehydrogenase family) n=1 Tax=Cellulomonas cellasea TaxID=43670 RepID=A0A7W4YCD8_9CELL|nr:SDR family NAD(P)-dependent oxidoreductase [Cellulomonas cellasea]MBB2924895.1 NAD(P)-dependent dehydrogenase (short-subunit alcohol dehydrogenase family) [Cellulomonas cellasea]
MSRILVTGSSDGIGLETARQLLAAGHDVVGHARNAERAADLRAAEPRLADVVVGDLASLAETRALAEAATAAGPFDAVIHNAGIGGGVPERTLTADGLERIFHVNTVAPYLLTALMPRPHRLVYLTSGLESQGRTHLDDLQFEARPWDGMQAYSDSKLLDVTLAFAVARLWPDVLVTAVDPGWIKTKLGGPDAWDEVDEGAATQVWLATSDDDGARVTGEYVKRHEIQVANPEASDVELQEGLLARLAGLTGVELPR